MTIEVKINAEDLKWLMKEAQEGNKDMYDYTSFHRWVRLQKALSVADVEIDTVEKH